MAFTIIPVFLKLFLPYHLANVKRLWLCDEHERTQERSRCSTSAKQSTLTSLKRKPNRSAKNRKEAPVMALITVKDGELYRRWIAHLSRGGSSTPAIRTEAFVKSQAGISVPLTR
jgi:hypothetical protein